jgi:hypothetical protein
MASRYFFCPTVLAVTPGFWSDVRRRSLMTSIEGRDAFLFDDAQSVGELTAPGYRYATREPLGLLPGG